MNRAHRAREMLKTRGNPKLVSSLLSEEYAALTERKKRKVKTVIIRAALDVLNADVAFSDHCVYCGWPNSYCDCIECLNPKGFRPQSGTTNDSNIMKIGNKSQYQNVKFADQHDPYMYQVKSRVDPTRTMQDSDDAMLENFFSRPIKIFSSQWDVGATYFEQFNPWSLYLNNPRVSNRIANFKLLRGKLKLKFVINGSGFQYGRLIASYLPLATADALSENRILYHKT
jgi:hypothetical protein